MSPTFQALVVRQTSDKTYNRMIEERSIDALPEGDVLIRVYFSSLNYKDGLSCIGNRGVTRHYPHTPGIDAAGIVESSKSKDFKSGDPVIVTSFDLGMNTPGGFGQFIRVPSDWVMPLPDGIGLRESMIYGTAGLTAALSLTVLQHHGVNPEKGPIVITGATGGVGSVAVSLFANQGYSVTASTGKTDADVFLKQLGATDIINRQAVDDKSGMSLLKERWAGAVDVVGNNTLTTLLRSCMQNGAVVTTGLVQSPNIQTTVFPFILRGVSLLGINSQGSTMALRKKTWHKLANEWKPETLETLAVDCNLDQLNIEINRILSGAQRGRVVVSLK